jgi:hypothetical protein
MNSLTLIHETGRMSWLVALPYTYHSQKFDRTIVVPANFDTDLASVPRFFWRLFPPCGTYLEAAVIHDYLYVQGGNGSDRKRADAIFLEAMKELNVGPVSRRLIWLAVRGFGWLYFYKDRANDRSAAHIDHH